MNDYDYGLILDDFEASMYDGGGECNRGGYGLGGGCIIKRSITYSLIEDVVVLRQTEKAICIEYKHCDGNTIPEWFPKSQLRDVETWDDEDRGCGLKGSFMCPDWLIESKASAYYKLNAECDNVVKSVVIDAKVTEIHEVNSTRIDNSWFECEECGNDAFNIREFKTKYHCQCSKCGLPVIIKKYK